MSGTRILPCVTSVLIMITSPEYCESFGRGIEHPKAILDEIDLVFQSCENKSWDLEKQIAKFEKVVAKKHLDLVKYAEMMIANDEFVSGWLESMGFESEYAD